MFFCLCIGGGGGVVDNNNIYIVYIYILSYLSTLLLSQLITPCLFVNDVCVVTYLCVVVTTGQW